MSRCNLYIPFARWGLRADGAWGIGGVVLGIAHKTDAARRVVVAGWALAFGAVGLAGAEAHVNAGGTRRPAGAGALTPVAAVTAPQPAAEPEPVPEPVTTTTTGEPPPTTTTTAPAAPPPPATTTTTAPATRAPEASGPSRQEQVEAIADRTGWDWRAAGVRLTVGFLADDCCHWGVYDSRSRIVWIGPTAFANPARLRYVVLHELAHAWQYHTARFTELIADYQPWGRTTPAEALEAGGDCIASLWGATDDHYWECPSAALQVAARRLAGDWN